MSLIVNPQLILTYFDPTDYGFYLGLWDLPWEGSYKIIYNPGETHFT
jgi:hypothetical protein